jgi:hypothetical protein
MTARFRTLYVFLLMEVGTRRIVHCNVTAHSTATWTLQQLREAIPSDHSYRFLIHDRDRAAPKKRTFHLLIQPDISCANDTTRARY